MMLPLALLRPRTESYLKVGLLGERTRLSKALKRKRVNSRAY
jgi:hypothetical protein